MKILAKGVDVSTHQKTIDWYKVAEAGYTFAIIRAGFRGYTNGKLCTDAYFENNIKGALGAGLEIGLYFFSTAVSAVEAREEAIYMVKELQDIGYSMKDIAFPCVYDLEGYTNTKYRSYGISKAQRTINCEAFNNVIEEAGGKTMLYGSQSTMKNNNSAKYDLNTLDGLIWCAKYPSSKTPNCNEKYFPSIGKYTERVCIWQYASCGTVAGINGNVDLDNMYIDVRCSNYNPYKEPDFLPEYGDRGESVSWLQWELQNLDYYTTTIDGRYGALTRTALTNFVKKQFLELTK